MYICPWNKIRKRYVKILYKHLVGFGGCKRMQRNVQKRLKQTTPPPPQNERKVYGAFSSFRNFLKKMKNYNQIIWWFQIKFISLQRELVILVFNKRIIYYEVRKREE